jgi:hypothetical protein
MRPTPAPRAPSAKTFLRLLPEIRNHVYSYCTPVKGYIYEYQGLDLACIHVHVEYKGEVTKIMEAKWRNRCASPLRTSMPGYLGDMASIMIELPKSVYYRPRDETGYSGGPASCLEPAVAFLLQLHWKSLTMTYYIDIPDPPNGHFSDILPCELAEDIYTYYHGRASNRQAKFSKDYSKVAWLTRKPIHTRLLRIERPDDARYAMADGMRYKH